MARDVTWRVPKRRLFSYPIPPATRTYKPVSHRELAEATKEAIVEAGFTIESEEYSAARDGKVANARYVLNEGVAGMQLELGWQNSYDKTLSVKFAMGTRIMICENGCVTGNFGAFAKKHMGNVREYTKDTIKEAIVNAPTVLNEIESQKFAMINAIIGKDKQRELVARLFFDEDLIGSTQLNTIKSEFKSPTYDYGGLHSIWEVYQYVTYSMKDIHPRLWMDNHVKVHEFFKNAVEEYELQSDIETQARMYRNFLNDVE